MDAYLANCVQRYNGNVKAPERKSSLVTALPKIRFDPIYETVTAGFRKEQFGGANIDEDKDDSPIRALLADYAFNLLFYYHFFRVMRDKVEVVESPQKAAPLSEKDMRSRSEDLHKDLVQKPLLAVLPKYLGHLGKAIGMDLAKVSEFVKYCTLRVEVRITFANVAHLTGIA